MTDSPSGAGPTTDAAPRARGSAGPGVRRRGPRKRAGAAIVPLALAQLMITLDSTILSVALPSLQPDLGLSSAARAWTVTGYTVAFGGLLLLGGRLGDLIGRRRALLVGVIGFAAVSAVAGSAVNPATFIGARALQGAFAALIAPSALALIGTTFTGTAERGRALGVYAATAMSGGGVGLIVGGALTDYLSWRWCMYVNVPIAAVVALGTWAAVADPPQPAATAARVRLDVPGALLCTLGMAGVIYGLGEAGGRGWGSAGTVGPLAAGAVLFAAFVAWQARAPQPLLPLRVVAGRDSAASFLAMMISAFCTFGMMLGMTYQLQTVMGYSPMRAGLAFLAFVGTAVVSATQLGRRLAALVRPGLLMTAGLLLYALALLLVTRLTAASTYWPYVFPPMVLIGTGVGLLTGPVVATVMAGADARDAGVVAAIVNTAQQAGGSVGAALLNAISVGAAGSYLAARPGDRLGAAVHGFTAASRWSAVVALAGAAVAFLAVNRPAVGKEQNRDDDPDPGGSPCTKPTPEEPREPAR